MNNNRKLITSKICWNGIDITINFTKNYWKSVNVSHLTVQTKNKERLPFAETGYRSIWLYDGELGKLTVEQYVIESLQDAAKSKKWKEYLKQKELKTLQKTQLSLF